MVFFERIDGIFPKTFYQILTKLECYKNKAVLIIKKIILAFSTFKSLE